MRLVRVPLAAVLLSSVGCATLQPVSEPAQFIRKANPQTVYVTLRNHSKVVLTQPRVSGDSLIGALQGVSYPVAVPLNHVQRIEAAQRDNKRTTWLIAGLSALTALSVYALAHAGGAGGPEPEYHPVGGDPENCPGC